MSALPGSSRMSFLTLSPPLSSVQHSLTHPELSVAVEMLSSVALINRALESGDMNTVWKQLSSSVTGLTNIEEENCQRWVPLTLTSVFRELALLFSLQES